MDSSAKSSGKPHKMSIVEFIIAHKPVPPYTKSSTGLSWNEIGIKDYSVHTVIRAIDKFIIALSELVGFDHLVTSADIL
ncbi:MAG TPA: hypothetical protein ENJ14_00335 [Bacteroidetes bacterium]|nr:hypothetical protein [Bacteroidota bacterium]